MLLGIILKFCIYFLVICLSKRVSERELSDEKKTKGVRERYLMIDDYILDIMNNFQNYYQSYFPIGPNKGF